MLVMLCFIIEGGTGGLNNSVQLESRRVYGDAVRVAENIPGTFQLLIYSSSLSMAQSCNG